MMAITLGITGGAGTRRFFAGRPLAGRSAASVGKSIVTRDRRESIFGNAVCRVGAIMSVRLGDVSLERSVLPLKVAPDHWTVGGAPAICRQQYERIAANLAVADESGCELVESDERKKGAHFVR